MQQTRWGKCLKIQHVSLHRRLMQLQKACMQPCSSRLLSSGQEQQHLSSRYGYRIPMMWANRCILLQIDRNGMAPLHACGRHIVL